MARLSIELDTVNNAADLKHFLDLLAFLGIEEYDESTGIVSSPAAHSVSTAPVLRAVLSSEDVPYSDSVLDLDEDAQS